eukprot:3475395-Rhodomonas_salina.1
MTAQEQKERVVTSESPARARASGAARVSGAAQEEQEERTATWRASRGRAWKAEELGTNRR